VLKYGNRRVLMACSTTVLRSRHRVVDRRKSARASTTWGHSVDPDVSLDASRAVAKDDRPVWASVAKALPSTHAVASGSAPARTSEVVEVGPQEAVTAVPPRPRCTRVQAPPGLRQISRHAVVPPPGDMRVASFASERDVVVTDRR
jgi:hypothetical protein